MDAIRRITMTEWAATARLLQLLAALVMVATLGQETVRAEEEAPDARKPTTASGTCRDCGVVRSIREVRTERTRSRPDIYTTSPQYLDTRPNDPPRIGPVFTLSWGKGEKPSPHVGAVGSAEMQQRYTEVTYEFIVRFDDGRFGLIEQDTTGDLQAGDRVQVVDKRVERLQ